MDEAAPRLGHYSIVRWIPNLVRGEFRNIAVVLVLEGEEEGLVKVLPNSYLPSTIKEKGIVADLLQGLQARACEGGFDVGALQELSTALRRSLQVTPPEPIRVQDGPTGIELLWKTYLKPKGGGAGRAHKPADVIASGLRRWIEQEEVTRNYNLPARTAGTRKIDFFVNHGHNIAIDTLVLSVRRKDELIHRADAEANKLRDINQSWSDGKLNFWVVCDELDLERPEHKVAARILGDTGAVLSPRPQAALVELRKILEQDLSS